MARTEIKVVERIAATAQAVADLCCDFGTIHLWHPAFNARALRGEGPGAVRILEIGNAIVEERLERVFDDRLGYEYSVLSYFIPVGAARGALRVRGEGERSSVLEMTLSFEAGPLIPEAALASALKATLRTGALAAKTRLEREASIS